MHLVFGSPRSHSPLDEQLVGYKSLEAVKQSLNHLRLVRTERLSKNPTRGRKRVVRVEVKRMAYLSLGAFNDYRLLGLHVRLKL